MKKKEIDRVIALMKINTDYGKRDKSKVKLKPNAKKLNLGCGFDILEGYDNLDEATGGFDFNKFPYPLKDNCYDFILLKGVLEHMTDVWKSLIELHRIVKVGGKIEIFTAHHNCEPSYNSLQHRVFFNEKSFFEFVIRNPTLYNVEVLEVKPTTLGKVFPRKIRDVVARYIGHLKGEIRCVLVKK